MPDFEITDPSGKKFIVTAPDGATQEDILAYAQSQQSPPSTLAIAGNAVMKGIASVPDFALNAPSMVRNASASAVGYAADKLGYPGIARGAESMKVDSPDFVRKGMTTLGVIDTSRDPTTRGERVLDTAIQSGVNALANPASSALGIVKNVAVGVTSGTIGAEVREQTGSNLLAIIAGVGSAVGMSGALRGATSPPINQVKKDTLRDAQAVGYVVSPSSVKPTFGTNRLESMAGRAATEQASSLRNQAVTDSLAKQAIGLADDIPLTEGAIESVRKQAGTVYEEVAAMSPLASIMLEKLKTARLNAKLQRKFYESHPDPDILKKAEALTARAEAYENALERIATKQGTPELMDRFVAARSLYARTYIVEKALNVGDGSVSAAVIGRMLDKGSPLTGELRVIGKFQQAFPKMNRSASMVSSPSVSGTDVAMEGALGTMGYAAGGPAGAAVGASLPLGRGQLRNLLLSDRYQSSLLHDPQSRMVGAMRGALVGKSLLDYRDETIPRQKE